MDIKHLKIFPYYRNVPDENGTLTVKCELLSYNEYINNLHYNPITHSNIF